MTVSQTTSRMGPPVFDPMRGFGVAESKTVGEFGFNTVLLKLIMDRWTPEEMRLSQLLGQRIIVDVDDFYEGIPESNFAFTVTNPESNKRTNRDNYKKVIEQADALVVSTQFLYNHHAKTHSDVVLIRNGINPRMFDYKKPTTRKPLIGWVGAVGYRGGDLETLQGWLPQFLEDNDLSFHHSGHDPKFPSFAEVSGVDPKRVTTSPLLPITRYHEAFVFDIGIVPLSNIPFNEAKSNIKGLEYAASGIPFVAADTAEYRKLSNDGVGKIAKTDEEWVTHMTDLLDYRERKNIARVSCDTVSRYWSIQSRAKEWQSVLKV